MRIFMNWTNKLKNISLLVFSLIFAFILVELVYRAILKDADNDGYKNRTMLFESGANFSNYDNFFKYEPNIEIRSVTLYSKTKSVNIDDVIIEYDNIISTNNAGLVMSADLEKGEDAFYIIGDSFTEGQGASPWFYELEDKEVNNTKLVNLGILGTGPQQWLSLANFIRQEFSHNVSGIVINLLPGDMDRNPWILKDRELQCLRFTTCNYKLGFQGFSFTKGSQNSDIRRAVLNQLNEMPFSITTVKEIIKKSYVIVDIYRLLKKNNNVTQSQSKNEQALLELKSISKDNLFINLVSHWTGPQTIVNSTNYHDYTLAADLVKFLEANSISFRWCDIPKNGFHVNDGHPKEAGYKVLRRCTERAVQLLSR